MAEPLFIFVRNGSTTRCFRSSRGGPFIDRYLLEGPGFSNDDYDEVALERAANGEALGGALVDHVDKKLLWFGGEATSVDVRVRRLMNRLIAACWSGWGVRHATRGMADLGEVLGFDVPVEQSTPWEDMGDGAGDFLLSGIVDDQLRVVLLDIDGDAALGHLDLSATLLMQHGVPPLSKLSVFPQGGLHLDVTGKVASAWCAHPFDVERMMHRENTGWELRWWGDSFEEQQKVLPGMAWPVLEESAVLEEVVYRELSSSNWMHLVEERIGKREIAPKPGTLRLSVEDAAAVLTGRR